jgi:hypothetical protein
LRRLPPGGFGGLTMSLDGGFDEVDESFFALASSPSNCAIRSRSGVVAKDQQSLTSKPEGLESPYADNVSTRAKDSLRLGAFA